VPESLLQASLFGVVRGAFTGAAADRAGVFEAAARGTLFLDEIENLSADAQKMLLTALNDGRIRRVGASADAPHSARVVAASNTRLEDCASEGRFRRDLLMRLNPALRLELPPLSERRADLPELARFCAAAFFATDAHARRIEDAVRDAGGDPSGAWAISIGDDEPPAAAVLFRMPRKAWAAMQRHPWPGNLRQFAMLLEDALASTLYGGETPRLEGASAVFDVDARLVFDLLAGARDAESPAARLTLEAPRASSVAAFRRAVEREAFRALFRESGGSFERMSERMTGSARHARAARLRFNRLGLSVREER
jgi:two-component system nitrogen regulation response regulator GlnG